MTTVKWATGKNGNSKNPVVVKTATYRLLYKRPFYSARIVCIEHCLYVNCVCVTLCEELNDDDDDKLDPSHVEELLQ